MWESPITAKMILWQKGSRGIEKAQDTEQMIEIPHVSLYALIGLFECPFLYGLYTIRTTALIMGK